MNEPCPLDSVFYPRSVAVLGVTPTPGTVPHDIFRNILSSGFTGVIYPVAPGKRSISSVRAYRYVSDIDDAVDLAVIVFPANVCEKALEECGRKGVKAAIIISAGFREVGPAGLEREQRLQKICAEHGIALIGPNCLGVINTDPRASLNASFARKMPAEGRIAFLSQSGALCTAVLDYARGKGIGFSKFVSFGNKAGVTEIDLLRYLHRDEQTDVILLYLEELRDGRALIEAAREITRGQGAKPILAIKSGRTPQGASAAASHTGSLAGEDAICETVFREAGIVRVGSIEELFNSAILLTYQPLPAGNRLAIVTNAGGPGVMATDAAVGAKLQMARFESATTEKLKAALPAAANIKNPVDVIGDARSERYMSAMDAVLDDPNVDQLLVILTPQSMTDIEAIAHGICQVRAAKCVASRCASGPSAVSVVEQSNSKTQPGAAVPQQQPHTPKPIACSFMGGCDVQTGIDILQAAKIPHYVLPEWACRAMADVQKVVAWRAQATEKPQNLAVDRAAAAAVMYPLPEGYLREDQALAVLQAYGFPVPPYKLCRNAQEAADFADKIGYPVVLRLVSPQVVHKFDVKGVILNLATPQAVREAYDGMVRHLSAVLPQAQVVGAIVRGMIPPGHEVILGAKRDAVFGPTLMFGLGGLFVEVFKDVTFALAPVDEAAADRMIHEVKACSLLQGARGTEVADLKGIRQCVLRLGQLVTDFPRIAEMDINPLLVGPVRIGCNVADVRIRLGENTNETRS